MELQCAGAACLLGFTLHWLALDIKPDFGQEV